MKAWDKVKAGLQEAYSNAQYISGRAKEEYSTRIKDYTYKAEAYGKALNVSNVGGGHNDAMDAFRHAYTSAKATKDYGAEVAAVGGVFHEVKGQTQDVIYSGPKYDQPLKESLMDIYNNNVGIQIGQRARREGWSDRRMAQEIKKAMDAGKLIVEPGSIPENLEPIYSDDENNNAPTSDKTSPQNTGEVQVEAYSRKTGEVVAHTRSRPDGDVSNNFSSKQPGGSPAPAPQKPGKQPVEKQPDGKPEDGAVVASIREPMPHERDMNTGGGLGWPWASSDPWATGNGKGKKKVPTEVKYVFKK